MLLEVGFRQNIMANKQQQQQRTWVSTAVVAKILGITPKRVGDYLRADRIHGAYKVHSQMWIIPLFNGFPIIQRCSKGPKPKWKTPQQPPIQRVHVNQRFLRYNKKHPENPVPIFALEDYKSKVYAEGVIFDGVSQLVHQPDRKLGCGAVAWEETYEPVSFVGKTTTYHEIMAIIKEQEEKDELENPTPKKKGRRKAKDEQFLLLMLLLRLQTRGDVAQSLS